MLFAISQRYYIESNSQQNRTSIYKTKSCLLSRKDTTLKAIHNLSGISILFSLLFAISQRYYIESNSQHGIRYFRFWYCCLLSRKDTTLKAIHNHSDENPFLLELFAISQRYYIESNSQQGKSFYNPDDGCLLSRKDTTLKAIHNTHSSETKCALAVCYLAKILHWKQFTTVGYNHSNHQLLFAISQRYYIESNSQPP